VQASGWPRRPNNLAKRPGAVRAAGVAAKASHLFAEKVRQRRTAPQLLPYILGDGL
jgi:hypothetical protein